LFEAAGSILRLLECLFDFILGLNGFVRGNEMHFVAYSSCFVFIPAGEVSVLRLRIGGALLRKTTEKLKKVLT